jgi:hypothetical protein
MSTEYGASLSDHVKAAWRNPLDGRARRAEIRAKCAPGREEAIVLILCAALRRLGGSIEPDDLDAATNALRRQTGRGLGGSACLDAEIAGLKKIGDKMKRNGGTLPADAMLKEYIRIFNNEDDEDKPNAALDRKLATVKPTLAQ